jgi:RimJ/RimL family protein N-acetyltransferase
MAFAETTSLSIRGYKDSDLDHLIALLSSPSKLRSDPVAVVPKSEDELRKRITTNLEKNQLYAILEVKQPLADGHSWVGSVSLWEDSHPKNRALMFAIALDERHWGKGYGMLIFWPPGTHTERELGAGTEATQWIVNHAFTQLNTRRIALQVMGDNLRAIALYKKVCVYRAAVLQLLSLLSRAAGLSRKAGRARRTTRTGSGGTSCTCPSSRASGRLFECIDRIPLSAIG